MCNI